LNSADSNLVKLLNKICPAEEDPEENKFSTHWLRILGLLWCEGDAKEKVHELYDNLQDNNQKTIAANDKDFRPNFFGMLDMCTSIVFECEKLFSDDEHIAPCPYSEDKINEIKEEKYEEMAEEFLD